MMMRLLFFWLVWVLVFIFSDPIEEDRESHRTAKLLPRKLESSKILRFQLEGVVVELDSTASMSVWKVLRQPANHWS